MENNNITKPLTINLHHEDYDKIYELSQKYGYSMEYIIEKIILKSEYDSLQFDFELFLAKNGPLVDRITEIQNIRKQKEK